MFQKTENLEGNFRELEFRLLRDLENNLRETSWFKKSDSRRKLPFVSPQSVHGMGIVLFDSRVVKSAGAECTLIGVPQQKMLFEAIMLVQSNAQRFQAKINHSGLHELLVIV